MDPSVRMTAPEAHRALRRFVGNSRRLFVLTGAGCSTDSGIPDYRSRDGRWKGHRPMQFGEFRRSASARRRYWSRAFFGWQRISTARPNRAHVALAWLESLGVVHHLITQNVDGLHQKAGSHRVLELHGRLAAVVCLGCGARTSRTAFQERLAILNAGFDGRPARLAPDGDAWIDPSQSDRFVVPVCDTCGGVLKPDVVFFGECVPPERVEFAMARLVESDALLVVGSSLMVWSGYRFARAAAARRLPVAIVNLGPTRADALAELKIEQRCGPILADLVHGTVASAEAG